MGLSFSPPDRLNPRENTVIGAATPASPASTHTLHEISGRGAVMQGHAWQEGTFISGGESHWYSFFSNLLCLTRQCAKNQTSELWLCMCVYNIRGSQKIKENTPIFQSWCEMWSALFEMSPSICLSSGPNRGEATYVVRVFLQVLFCVCLLQMCSLLDTSACFSQCVCDWGFSRYATL